MGVDAGDARAAGPLITPLFMSTKRRARDALLPSAAPKRPKTQAIASDSPFDAIDVFVPGVVDARLFAAASPMERVFFRVVHSCPCTVHTALMVVALGDTSRVLRAVSELWLRTRSEDELRAMASDVVRISARHNAAWLMSCVIDWAGTWQGWALLRHLLVYTRARCTGCLASCVSPIARHAFHHEVERDARLCRSVNLHHCLQCVKASVVKVAPNSDFPMQVLSGAAWFSMGRDKGIFVLPGDAARVKQRMEVARRRGVLRLYDRLRELSDEQLHLSRLMSTVVTIVGSETDKTRGLTRLAQNGIRTERKRICSEREALGAELEAAERALIEELGLAVGEWNARWKPNRDARKKRLCRTLNAEHRRAEPQ